MARDPTSAELRLLCSRILSDCHRLANTVDRLGWGSPERRDAELSHAAKSADYVVLRRQLLELIKHPRYLHLKAEIIRLSNMARTLGWQITDYEYNTLPYNKLEMEIASVHNIIRPLESELNAIISMEDV